MLLFSHMKNSKKRLANQKIVTHFVHEHKKAWSVGSPLHSSTNYWVTKQYCNQTLTQWPMNISDPPLPALLKHPNTVEHTFLLFLTSESKPWVHAYITKCAAFFNMFSPFEHFWVKTSITKIGNKTSPWIIIIVTFCFNSKLK